MEICIDPEFQTYMSRLSAEEYQQLEVNLKRDGCRDPLAIWQSGDDTLLLDGHHRLEICKRLGIEYRTIEINLTSRDAALDWIVQNQLGRRNLTAYARAELVAKLEPRYEAEAKEKLATSGPGIYGGKPPEETLPQGVRAPQTRDHLGALAGVSGRTYEKAKIVREQADEDTKDRLRRGEETINKAYTGIVREQKREQVKEQLEELAAREVEQPTGKYDVIVIDPPWPYGTEYDPETRRVASPYPEMSLDELNDIELPADDNCILWLWTTHKFLLDAFDLMEAWEFKYKAILTWDKQQLGMGHWLRCQCEFCLLGIRGKPLWAATDIRDIISAARRQHSRKPDEFYQMIDEHFPGRKLDYFAREERRGWDTFGTGEQF